MRADPRESAWASSIIEARRAAFASRSAIWRSTRLSVGQVDPALDRIGGLAQPFAVALAGGLVLEQLADLGEREPGVVAKAADELESVEVRGVVEAVVAIGASRRLRSPISS